MFYNTRDQMQWMRRILKERIRAKDCPTLCEEHSKNLVQGQMAFIDAKRCDECAKGVSKKPSLNIVKQIS